MINRTLALVIVGLLGFATLGPDASAQLSASGIIVPQSDSNPNGPKLIVSLGGSACTCEMPAIYVFQHPLPSTGVDLSSLFNWGQIGVPGAGYGGAMNVPISDAAAAALSGTTWTIIVACAFPVPCLEATTFTIP